MPNFASLKIILLLSWSDPVLQGQHWQVYLTDRKYPYPWSPAGLVSKLLISNKFGDNRGGWWHWDVATTRLKTAVWKQGKSSTNQWRVNSQNRCRTRGKGRNLGAPILRGSSAQNHNLPLAEMTCLLLRTTSTERYLLPLLLQVLSIIYKLLKYGLPCP